MNSDVYSVLEERGYIYQCTDLENVRKMLTSDKPLTFYLGIDPTADSLHIGHFFALMVFRYLQEAGHRGILVIGGATALVGDPSGKSDMRKMLSKEEVMHNLEEVKQLSERFISTDGENPAIILNNADWINSYSYVDFMRKVGVHFNINTMLATEAYSSRLKEGGLTFLEMGYMLMQAYDFAYLNREYGCKLQIGGSDQWGNIVAGTNLNRKMRFFENLSVEEIYGMTNPLLLTKEGKKMGKSENGTLWIAREKTTPYDFYQYFYNVSDEDVDTLLRLFTRVPLNEINELISKDIIQAKRLMAYEITKIVHGKAESENVVNMVDSLFKKGVSSEFNAPEVELPINMVKNGYSVIELAIDAGLVKTKSEARRLIVQGGLYINNDKITNIEKKLLADNVENNSCLLRKGKKTYVKVIFK